jgi:hypothetical protein
MEKVMTVFGEARLAFIGWCKRERQTLQRQYDLFSGGTCRMWCNREDITQATLAGITKDISELDRLIAKCE